ncbi:F-box associated domain-containing protein [Caenorhabditis elegans]|uniref:F-box associated domain-containing protein n=1 Tax=Caenorhabditis elegans TaxID=6239 RepID=O02112_CAEEL|nr:F-box associated domain-containing protein [Caenorhabditis elegans]CCD63940.2 F-box associated domain-containing protein [Caenorhabditis elegans]|eukprot:NP_493765.3 Uncharacterized protein CELE_W08F4.10 [Caenorhabditis elegans]
MEFILKNFDLKHGFSNHCLQATGFNHKLWANIQRLDVQAYSSLTLDKLRKMNCETIQFEYLSEFSGTHLNEFIRYWLDGNMPKLRRFQLNYCFEHWTDDLWNGLPHAQCNPKRRKRFFYDGLEVVDCSEGRDIERSDGILATILVESKVLYFLIWHDRFPVDVRALF